ncbi:MAG: hypothetical protein WA118_08900 [Carboxydocellales bacterium]
MKLEPEAQAQPKNPLKGKGIAVNFSRQLTAKERLATTTKLVAAMTQAEKDQLLEDLRAAVLEG